MKPSSRLLALACVVAAAVACGKKDDKPAGGNAPPANGAKTAEPAGDKPAGAPFDSAKATGSIKGVVKFKGTPPEQKKLPKGGSSDVFCKGSPESPVEAIEVNQDGTLPHVFVYASKGPFEGMTGFTPQEITIDQQGCTYVPHVVGVMAGQKFTIKTSDKTTHNVKASPQRQKGFNLSQPEGKADTVSFEKKESAIKVQCDVHSWMSAVVHSMDHPFYATSSREGGTFEIKGLLPGKYVIKAWHETWAKDKGGKDLGEIEVKDGQATELAIELGE